MLNTVLTEKLPIKLWLDDMEPDAMAQARNLANFPFAFSHVAIMPDAHLGYGMPIGGVLATDGVIIPNAIGVDIGCGMCAVRTSLNKISRDNLKMILGGGSKHHQGIRSTIPVGFKRHKKRHDRSLMPPRDTVEKVPGSVVLKEYASARKQLGTLGGGNHFVEIQAGDDGHIWLMIHSGSRNIGYKVARYYNQLAIKLNEKWESPAPKKWQLAYLPLDSAQGQHYLTEMEYCVSFALANRKQMMLQAQKAVTDVVGDVTFDPIINIAHNFGALENHFDTSVMVHRKGATRATQGLAGIIPGSQGSSSYIVRGRGNPESFMSCSHGAGRKLGRKQAQRSLDLKAEIKRLDDRGILHAIRGKRDLDEAAGAYKDIATVMANQADLVEIEVTLTPLAVVKG